MCNSWQGWVESDCTTLSFSSSVTIFWMAAIMLLGFKVFYDLFFVCLEFYRQGRLRRVNIITSTVFFAGVSAFSGIVWALMILLSVATSVGNKDNTWHDRYKGNYYAVTVIFGPSALITGSLAILNVSLLWIEILYCVQHTTTMTSASLNHTKKVIYVFEGMAIILGIGGAVYEKKNDQNITGFLLFPLVLFIIGCYAYGSWNLSKIIASLETHVGERPESFELESQVESHVGGSKTSQSDLSDTESVEESVKYKGKSFLQTSHHIRVTAIKATAVLFGFMFAAFMLSLLDSVYNWKELTPPGFFSSVKFYHHMEITFIVVGNLVVVSYFKNHA